MPNSRGIDHLHFMRQSQPSDHMHLKWSLGPPYLQSKEDASPEMLALPSTLSQAAGTRFAARPLPQRSSSAPLWAPSPEPEDVPASLRSPSELAQSGGWSSCRECASRILVPGGALAMGHCSAADLQEEDSLPACALPVSCTMLDSPLRRLRCQNAT